MCDPCKGNLGKLITQPSLVITRCCSRASGRALVVNRESDEPKGQAPNTDWTHALCDLIDWQATSLLCMATRTHKSRALFHGNADLVVGGKWNRTLRTRGVVGGGTPQQDGISCYATRHQSYLYTSPLLPFFPPQAPPLLWTVLGDRGGWGFGGGVARILQGC